MCICPTYVCKNNEWFSWFAMVLTCVKVDNLKHIDLFRFIIFNIIFCHRIFQCSKYFWKIFGIFLISCRVTANINHIYIYRCIYIHIYRWYTACYYELICILAMLCMAQWSNAVIVFDCCLIATTTIETIQFVWHNLASAEKVYNKGWRTNWYNLLQSGYIRS